MEFKIKNRWTGAVQIAAEINCDDTYAYSRKLGLAVRWSVGNNANLRGADLIGANLSGADLIGADLIGADLSGADLSEADLSEAHLREAHLRGANLREAHLRGANLREAHLRDANLSGADLIGANLSGADLRDANLRGADLRGADLLCIGNMRELRTMQFDKWMIGYTADTMQIGCQRHAIEKWRKWNTDAGRKWIAQMDAAALEWAERNFALVLQIIDANPATPTGKETQ